MRKKIFQEQNRGVIRNNTYTENTADLWAILEPVVYALIKDATALWKSADGVYHYEVNPIPGDHIDKTTVQTALAADFPDDAILQAIGGKYFDAIDAAEQALCQSCLAKMKLVLPNETLREISLLLSQKVIIHAPISYYKRQPNGSGRLL